MDRISLLAYAKLTLALEVVGARDDGFHDLDAIVVSVSAPADRVTLEVASTEAIEVHGPAARGVPEDGSNLAARALAVLRDYAIDVPPLKIVVEKHIPAGAGLGGGSADAAAVLLGARAQFGLDLEDMELCTFGEQIGSDVPACIIGGMTHMTGRGEHIESLPWSGPFGIVTVVPSFRLETAAVYREWDVLDGPRSTRIVAPTERGPSLRNDLEPAADSLEPRLAAVRTTIVDVTGREPLLAGSGSAYAIVTADGEDAAGLAEAIRSVDAGLEVFAGTAVDRGVVVI